jgi:hypothetical protein
MRDEIDVERDADPEKKGQGDDVREVERESCGDHRRGGQQGREHERREHEQDVANAAKKNREKHGYRDERGDAGPFEGCDHRVA